jgi:two-component system, OmpR family, sensor histidine kinase BaeS
MKLSAKLFIALTALSTVIVVASGVASRISFRRGFLGYVNEQSFSQARDMVPRFEAAYASHGDWQFIRESYDNWREVLSGGSPKGHIQANPSRPSDAVFAGLLLRLALLDSHLVRVAGDPEFTAETPRTPIRFRGETVGWLAVVPFESVSDAASLRFQNQQLMAELAIGAVSVLLAALLASVLTRRLLRPLRQMESAAQEMAHGNYSQRLEIDTQDEIGSLSRYMDRLASTLEQNEKLRRSFVADISHELRTPLAVLRAELEAVEDSVRPPTRETLQSLSAEVTTMGNLVGSLYDLSLSDVGAIVDKRAPVDVTEVLRITVLAFRARFMEKQLEVRVDIPDLCPMIDGSETRVQQLFNNLLENSLRYTAERGQVDVRLAVKERTVIIDVLDSAPGVPEAELPRIFERFYRADRSRNRATGGTGLGLAICEGIVAAHAGTITAQPSPLGGLWIRVLFRTL